MAHPVLIPPGMTTSLVPVTAVVVLAATTAQAQPARVQPDPLAIEVPELKSENVTTGASAIGTAVPLVLFTAAWMTHYDDDTKDTLLWAGGATLLVGPTAGHWYAGKIVSTGLGLRLGGAALMALSSGLAGQSAVPELLGADGGSYELGIAGVVLGGGLMAVGAIHDIATADNAARAYNHKHARTLNVTPTITREQTGFALVGTF